MTKEAIWRGFEVFIHTSFLIDFLLLAAGIVQCYLVLLAFIDVPMSVLIAPLIIAFASLIVKFILFAIMLVLLTLLPLKDE